MGTLIDMNTKTAIKLAVVALLLFIALSVGTSLTKRPWSDEGWFAAAGYNLAMHGKPGTLVLEPREFREGIDRYTYWTAPLYYPLQAGWYWVFGFSLVSMRSLSTFFGVVLLLSWYLIALRLFEDRWVAFTVLALLAVDYVIVMGASFGRMDIICTAFGSAALAAYLSLRTINLTLALLLSQTLVVLSGLTHFLGLLFFIALFIIVVYFDRRVLRPVPVMASFVPYLVGVVGWGIYIYQEPALFVAQFTGNAADSGRLSTLTSPVAGLKKEIVERYLVAYGLASHSAGSAGPIWLKSLVLVAYLMGLATIILFKELRSRSNVKLLLAITITFFVVLTLLDGQKLSYYLMNITPLYTLFVAIAVVFLYRKFSRLRIPVVLGIAGLMALQSAGLAYRMSLNGYANQFDQAAAFLRENRVEGDVVMASAEMAFALGFEGEVTDDHWLGFGRDRKPDFFVLEEVYEDALDGKRRGMPDIYDYVTNTLKNDYELVYDREHYRIFKRK